LDEDTYHEVKEEDIKESWDDFVFSDVVQGMAEELGVDSKALKSLIQEFDYEGYLFEVVYNEATVLVEDDMAYLHVTRSDIPKITRKFLTEAQREMEHGEDDTSEHARKFLWELFKLALRGKKPAEAVRRYLPKPLLSKTFFV